MKENDIDIEKNTSNNEREKKQKKNENEIVEITEEEIATDNLLDEESEKSINLVNNHNEKLIEARKERIYEKSKLELKKNSVRYKIKPALIATMAIIIILTIYFLIEFGPIVGININNNSKISEESKIDVITTESDIYETYNGELLVYSNNNVSTYNNHCQKTWSYNITENFTPNIYIYNEYMIIANNSNGTIYMFENKKEIYSKKIEGIIHNVYIDDFGNIAVEYSTTGYKKIIGVFDRNGRSKFDTYLSSSPLIEVKIIDSCKKLLVAQANSNSFKVGVTLSIVDSTKSEDNIKEICKLDNNLLYDVNIQGQYAIVLLDNKICKVDLNTGNISDIKKFDDSQPLFVTIYDDYYICLSKELNKENNSYNILTSRYNGIDISNIEVQNSPKLLYRSGILNYFIYQDCIQVVNKWGVEVKTIPIEFIPKDVIIFNNEKSIGLVYTNKIYVINI